MTTQPEALRLADALDGWDDGYSATPRLAAAELRRLHAELAAMTVLIEQPVQEPVASCQHKRYSVDVHEQTGHCFDCGAEGRMRFVVGNREQRDIARAAIAKAIGEQS